RARPGTDIRLTGARVGDRLLDLVAHDDREAVELARIEARVDGVLPARRSGVEDVRHVREGDARLDARVVRGRRVVVPGAVPGPGVEAGLVVHLRLRDHELAVREVGNSEMRDRSLCLL